MKVCPQCGGTYPTEVGFCPMDGVRLQDSADRASDSDDPLDEAEQLVGQTLDRRYRLDELIGEGGMAFVYRATHTLIGKAIAVKVLRPDLVHDAEVVRRFLQEARLASAVKHPNVVDISDYGELEDGGAYYIMEYLRGRTLQERIAEGGALPPVEAIAIALQICHGLEAAHDQNIIHRDLKPENVFLRGKPESAGTDPRVKLLDFGIARVGPRRMTAAGAVLGTPTYMAPEQAKGDETDRRSDLYSLGIMLFEMLVGWVPFKSDDVAEVLQRQINQEPPRIEAVKPALIGMTQASDLVAELLAKDPEDRPSTAAAVRERLSRALERDLPDGSKVRMLKSTLAMGSGSVSGDGGPPKLVSGGAIKEAPIDWGKTERPGQAKGGASSLVASPGRKHGKGKGPAVPPAIEPTPIMEPGGSPPRKLGAVIAGTSVVAAVATFGVYSALVGFPTSHSEPTELEPPGSTPVAPAASSTRVTPSTPRAASNAARPATPPAQVDPPPPAPTPPTPAPTQEAAKADAKATVPPKPVSVDRKPGTNRSKVKTRPPKRSKPKALPEEEPNPPATKGEKVPEPASDPAPPTESKPPDPVPPKPAESPEPSDLKDPFD